MKDLTDKEKEILLGMIKRKPQKRKDGYFTLEYNGNVSKRSRVIMQLHLNKKLEVWEIIHHKDRNKENDNINNLMVMSIKEHRKIHNLCGLKQFKDNQELNLNYIR